MVKKYLFFVLLALIPAYKFGVIPGFSSGKVIKGSGVAKREVRDIKLFDGIDISGMGTVFLTHGPEEQLEIETDDNILEHIFSQMANSELQIGSHNVILKPTIPIKFYITYTNLKHIQLTGAVQLQADNRLEAPALNIGTAGATRVTLDLIVDILHIDSAGSTTMNLQGKAKNQTIELSGACKYNAGKLASEQASIEASGSVHATLKVDKKIKGELFGAAIVSYIGSPEVSVFSHGASSIQKVG